MSKQLIYNAETCEYEPLVQGAQDLGKARTKQESTKVKLYEYLIFGILNRGCITNNIALNTDVIELIRSFSIGTQKDIDFLSKTIVSSREKWKTKNSISILALVVLSASPKKYAKDKFSQIFSSVVKNDSDLIEFMEYINTDSIRGFGKVIQKAIQNWFDKLSPYDALKFEKTTQRAYRGYNSGSVYTVSDILRLAHVKPKNNEQSALYKWLLTGEISQGIHQSISASEWYKKSTTLSPQKREITRNNNIPIEILKPVKSPIDAYENIFYQLSFEDLISNFTFLAKKGIFSNEDVRKRAVSVLTSERTINKSNILPYQLLELYDQNTTENFEILSALEKAAEHSLTNLPKIEKTITIFVDKSSEAKNSFASQETQVSLNYTFSTFSSIIAKMADNVDIYTFSDNVEKKTFDKTKSTLRISDSIIDESRRSSQMDPVALFKFLYESDINSDFVILFSASHSWKDVLSATNAGSYLSAYISKVNKSEQQFIFVNSKPMSTTYSHQLNGADFIHGWNDRNLKYLLYLLQSSSVKIDDIIK